MVVERTEANEAYYDLLPENAAGEKVKFVLTPESFAPPMLAGLALSFDTQGIAPNPPTAVATAEAFETRAVAPPSASEPLTLFPRAEADADNPRFNVTCKPHGSETDSSSTTGKRMDMRSVAVAQREGTNPKYRCPDSPTSLVNLIPRFYDVTEGADAVLTPSSSTL